MEENISYTDRDMYDTSIVVESTDTKDNDDDR